jgi:hypothetical protein
LAFVALMMTGQGRPLQDLDLRGWWLTAFLAVDAIGIAALWLRIRTRLPWRELPMPWDRLASFAITLFAIRVTLLALLGWKLAIPHWRGFTWDPSLARLDAALHGGMTPDRWLLPLVEPWLPAIDWIYSSTWYALLAAVTLWAGWSRSSRYLLASTLAWIILGIVVATAFASAGPCYFTSLGYGDTYQPLMQTLRRQDLSALAIQAELWRTYQGAPTSVVAGISAFPSLHLALPTLYALAFRRLRWAFVGYLLVTLLGSIVLGWHYAVDGYAGILGGWGCWWLAGKIRPSGAR